MHAKLFEIRDRGTFVVAMAVRLKSRSEEERYLLARAGFGRYSSQHDRYVLILPNIGGGKGQFDCDPHGHGQARTYRVAHNYILEHWDALESGAVICVEHILGERETPKQSERHSAPSGGRMMPPERTDRRAMDEVIDWATMVDATMVDEKNLSDAAREWAENELDVTELPNPEHEDVKGAIQAMLEMAFEAGRTYQSLANPRKGSAASAVSTRSSRRT